MRLIKVTGVALALVLTFTAGSVFVASGNTPNQTYYGCVSPGVGTLTRIQVDTAPKCPKRFTLIEWNSEGVQGNTGPQGPQGLQGDTGLQGSQGLQGEQGPQGIQGPAGDTGPTGPAGSGFGSVRTVLDSRTVASQSADGVIARCGEGEILLNGGYRVSNEDNTLVVSSGITVTVNGPQTVFGIDDPNTWNVTIVNTTNATVVVHALATCATFE